MISDNENSNLKPVKSHLKPLPDGSYEIAKSEGKVFYYVAAAFVFALASLYMMKGGYNIVSNIFLLSFALSSAVALKMVLFKKVVLTINDKFLIITSMIGTSEQVLWEDITGFSEVRDKRNHYITVMVKDPEEILELQQNKLTYKLMRHNIKLYGTPFLIQTDNLNAHRKEIMKLLKRFHDEYLEQGVL